MAKPTYYQTLNVAQTATADQIKQAYRSLAREYHPDVNSSPDAEATFKEINAAYDTLSDSLKRADYDQSLADPGVRSTGGGSYSDPSVATNTGAASYAGGSPDRSAMMRAAYARTAAMAGIAAAVGVLIQLAAAVAAAQPFEPFVLVLGAVPAAIVGALWGADYNFKVESFLGSGWLGRSYTFVRTVGMSLGLAYYAAILGRMIDSVAGGPNLAAPVLILIAVLAGAVIGSDGDTPDKLRANGGRFNLFYTLIRGAEIGAIGGAIGAVLGAILAVGGYPSLFGWSAFIGFSLGMIVGSIKPPNLAAYASYASASVKNVIVMLMVLLAVLGGIGVGIVVGPALTASLAG